MDKTINQPFGTLRIARICRVARATVARWIEEGKLPAYTTGGGHRRVWGRDLAAFLKAHNLPIPPDLLAQSRARILVVDDEMEVRKLVNKMIEGFDPDVEIAEARDGFEAGQKMTQMLPSLVILDLNLPGIDGYQVCERIRNDSGTRTVKILAISGGHTDDARPRAIQAGADDFLKKPFKTAELVAKIGTLLGDRNERR